MLATAANYYVDFSAGSDTKTGAATNTAWQHCPGDANATSLPAATTLHPGDVVNFRGGVVYDGQVQVGINGSAGSPITFQSDAGWGSGQAIMVGTLGGTNGYGSAFLIGYYGGGNYITVSGFEIRNFLNAGVQSYGNNTTVFNNLIHHIGRFPYSFADDGGYGFGFYVRGCANPICVSNTMYDLNEVAFYPVPPLTNCIVWGNEFYHIQDHAIIGGISGGYTLIAYNRIHDQTNALSHDDGIQIMYWGFDTNCLIVAKNILWNNNQDIFLNPGGSGYAVNGDAYLFDNVLLNTDSINGTGGYFNGIRVYVGINSWNNLYIFNNTVCMKNAAYGGVAVLAEGPNSNNGLYYDSTNLYDYNNLLYQSYSTTTNTPNLHNIFAGYNAETNSAHGNWLGNNEISSVYGSIVFANFNTNNQPNSDFHLAAGSTGIGQGTNLSSFIPSNKFSFLPAPYQIDPTKDAAGSQRGTSWDIGAYQHSSNGATSDPPAPPNGLVVVGP